MKINNIEFTNEEFKTYEKVRDALIWEFIKQEQEYGNKEEVLTEEQEDEVFFELREVYGIDHDDFNRAKESISI